MVSLVKMQRRESLTDDEKIGSTAGMTTLLESMRGHQNEALAQDVYYDASQMQQAIMTVLNASSGSRSTGMSMPVVTRFEEFFKGCIDMQEIVDVNSWLTFTKGM